MAEKFGIKFGIDSSEYKKELSQTKSKTQDSINSMQQTADKLAQAIVKSLSKFVDQFEKVQEQSKKTGEKLEQSTGKSLDRLSRSAKDAGQATGSFVQKMAGDLDAVISAFDKLGSVADGALDQIINASPLASAAMSMVQFQVRLIAKEFGDALAPSIQQTAERFEKLRKFVEQLPDPIKEVIAKGLAFVAAFTTVASVLSVVSIALSALSGPLIAIGVGVAVLAIAWKKNLGNIQQKTQTVVTSLVELFNVIVEQFNIVKESFLGNNVEMGASADQFLTTLLTGFTNSFNTILALVTDTVKMVASVISSNMDLIMQASSTTLNALSTLFGSIFFAINKIVADNSEQITSTFGTMLEAFIVIGNSLAEFYGKVADILSTEITSFANENSDQIGRIISKFGELIEVLTPIVQKIVKLLTKVLSPAFGTFVSVVSKTIGSLLTVIEGVFDTIIGLLTGDMERVTSGIEAMVTGLLNTFVAPLNGLIDILNKVFDKIKDWAVVPDWLKNAIPTIPNIPEFEEGGYIAREMIAKLHPGEVVLTANQVRSIGGKEAALSLGRDDFSAFDQMISGMVNGGGSNVTNKRESTKVVNYVTIANANFRDETDMRRFKQILERNSFDDLRGDTITNTRG